MTSCIHVAYAGKSRTRDHSSATFEVAGPAADHPPPAAESRHCVLAKSRPTQRGEH